MTEWMAKKRFQWYHKHEKWLESQGGKVQDRETYGALTFLLGASPAEKGPGSS